MAIQRAVILDSGRVREIPVADTLDVGSGLDAASGKSLTIGGTNATSIGIGTSSLAINLYGNVELGTDSDNTITVSGLIGSNLFFDDSVADRTIYPISTTGTTGIGLGIAGGATGDANAGGSLLLIGGQSTGGVGGGVTVSGGTGATTGGAVYIKGGSGFSYGTVYIGATQTAAVSIAATGINTTIAGPLLTSENVTLGSDTSDTVTYNARVGSDITFTATGDRAVSVTSKAGTGSGLTLAGGQSTDGAGGYAALVGGAGVTTGGSASVLGGTGSTAGTVYIGTSNTSVVEIGSASIATSVNGDLTVDDDTTLGTANTDQLNLNASIFGWDYSGVIRVMSFVKEYNHAIAVLASTTANANGGSMTFIGANAASGTGTGGGFNLQAGTGGSTAGTGGQVSIQGGGGGTSSGAGGDVYISAGGGGSTDGSGGDCILRGGGKTGAGTAGTVYIGDEDTGAVSIGASGVTTSIVGNLKTGAHRKIISNDAESTSTSFADVTDLGLSVSVAGTYYFRALIVFQAEETTTGIGLAMNGPTATLLAYRTAIATTATQGTDTDQVEQATSWDTGTATTGIDSGSTDRIATIEGAFVASGSGTLAVRFKSEVDSSKVTVRAGSMLEMWAA